MFDKFTSRENTEWVSSATNCIFYPLLFIQLPVIISEYCPFFPVLFCAMLSPFSALLPCIPLYKNDFISRLADGNP